jgi:segregation and condensation protein B
MADEAPIRDELPLKVEALLFAVGKPLTVHELSRALGTEDWKAVQVALKKLHHAYASRLTSLEVARAGDGWIIQVRKAYLPTARTVAAPELPKKLLKTLALIAYHQPILQSRLVRMLGDSAYDDVPRLRDLGFVRASEKSNTLELTTSTRFAEYFGFDTTDRAKLKKLLGRNLGIPDAPETSEVETPEEKHAGPGDVTPGEGRA